MGEDSEEEKPVLVLDSSVLILLMETGKLDILEEMSTKYRIITPRAVEYELARAGRRIPPSIFIESPRESLPFQFLSIGLGEKEVIGLTLELIGEGMTAVAILDDRKARSVASRLGLPYMGTLGLIELAKKEQVITKSEAVFLLEEISHTSFYVTQDLKETVIEKIRSQKM